MNQKSYKFFSESDIVSIATKQLAKYKLRHKGWKVEVGQAKTQAGICFYDRRVIRISLYIANLMGEDELKETILHEIAHALAGAEAHHGSEWKKWCITIGARPEATFKLPDDVEYKWEMKCQNHGIQGKRHRRRASRVCRLCAKQGISTNIEYRLIGTETEWDTFI